MKERRDYVNNLMEHRRRAASYLDGFLRLLMGQGRQITVISVLILEIDTSTFVSNSFVDCPYV